MPLVLNPPPTPVEPVTEVLHGVPITDPYRWLEDQNSSRTRKWLEEQSAYTRAYLDAIPGREQIRKRVEQLLAVEVNSEPWKVGNRYFFLKRAPYQEQPMIVMREAVEETDIVLVDPAERCDGVSFTVSIMNISNDGKLLAYGVRQGGEDSCAVEFLDVDRLATLRDCLPRGYNRGLVFDSSGKGFYYSHECFGTQHASYHGIRYHAFGTESCEDSQVFSGGNDPNVRLILFSSYGSRQLGYYKLYPTDPVSVDFWVQDFKAASPPRLIVEKLEGLFIPLILGNTLVALTDWESPNGRIVSIDLNDPRRDAWCEIVSTREARIQGFAVLGDFVFVGIIENATTRIEKFDLSGKSYGALSCPPYGTSRILPSRPDSNTLWYSFTSFSHSPTIFQYSVETGEQEVWAQSHVPFDSTSIAVERIEYASKDGTKIPMFLVRQKERRTSNFLPTFLTGYGGFGNSITPQFTAYATFLIEQGFLFAVANLRGGAEFGEQWHMAGKRHKRQNAIDDFISAAEWLVAQRYATPGGIAIGGGSNAGLLVGAALTQRPDLFGAVICLGPLLDMLRYHKFDQANLWVEEYGNADIQDDFHYLKAYSPYHQVQDGSAYPAIMLISGDADMRCNPMHARKMAARLQAASTSGRPVLLDYKPTWGHMPVQPLSSRIAALTDRLAFLCNELEVAV